MATSSLIEAIETDFLSCSICLDDLKDPVCLPCLHGFCYECLDKWAQASRDRSMVICPSCKTSTEMPRNGIRGFPTHFLVKNLKETVDTAKDKCSVCEKQSRLYCIECKKALCHDCLKSHNAFTKDHKIVTIEEYKSGQVSDKGRFCKVHEELVRYFCTTELKGVCYDCVGLKTCGNDHQRVTVKEAAQMHRKELAGAMKRCSDIKVKCEDAMETNKQIQRELNNSKILTLTDIEKVENEYIEKVRDAFKVLKEEADKVDRERNNEITNNLKALELVVNKIQGACKDASQICESKSDYLITHEYPAWSKTLTSLANSRTEPCRNELGYMTFESYEPNISSVGKLNISKNVVVLPAHVPKYGSDEVLLPTYVPDDGSSFYKKPDGYGGSGGYGYGGIQEGQTTQVYARHNRHVKKGKAKATICCPHCGCRSVSYCQNCNRVV